MKSPKDKIIFLWRKSFFERQFFLAMLEHIFLRFPGGRRYITVRVDEEHFLASFMFLKRNLSKYFTLHQAFFKFRLKVEKGNSARFNISVTYPLVKIYKDEFLSTQSDWTNGICFLGFLNSIWTNRAEKIMLLIVHPETFSSLWI